MDAGQSELYEAASIDEAAYLIVDWHEGEKCPRWTINRKFDGTQGVKIHRDPNTGEALFAAKQWQMYDPFDQDMDGRTRVTLYFPDRVEKYISAKKSNDGIGGTQWQEYSDADGEPWPIPWTGTDGQPMGVAAIEFSNPGGSEIADVVPLQDMLNKTDLDLISTCDYSGWRLLWATGVQPTIDASDGNEEEPQLQPGSMLRLTDPQAKVGAIEPVDPRLVIHSSKYWIEAVAGVSRTPQYLFQALGADQPSGESLRQQETGLVHKVKRKQVVYGNAWEDVLYLSARLAQANGVPDAEVVHLSTVWDSAELPPAPGELEIKRGQARQANSAAGLPLAAILREEGLSDDDVASVLADRADEQNAVRASFGAVEAEAARRRDQNKTDV